ncbi:MAG: cytochrome P450 [Myxococcota bacterium]
MEYDPYSYAIDEDPYPVYRHLRDAEPAYHNERLGFWAFSRFDDCHAALLDWKTYSSAHGTVLELMDSEIGGPLIIFMDPPRQTRLRNLVSKAFTPRRIAELEPRIREIAAGYLDALVGRQRFDVVKDFTAKLPMDVISTLLGIPPEDRDAVRGWSNDVLHREPDSPGVSKRGLEAMTRLMAYFDEALAERRRRPRDDIMTLLTQAEFVDEKGEPSRLSDEEIKAFFNLLATAGNETVTKLLATAFYWLAEYPDQRKLLVEDPGLAAGAVEEVLRFDPPSQYQGRVLTRDVEAHGRTIPAGAKLLVINAASGRDERKYPDPDVFDVRRRFDLHLNFGYGPHFCLGKSLARLESRIAHQEFLARFPEYGVAGVERMHSSNVRGFSGLVLEV